MCSKKFKPRWRFVDIGLKPKGEGRRLSAAALSTDVVKAAALTRGADSTLATKAAALITDVLRAAALARGVFPGVEGRGAHYSSFERRGAAATGNLIS